MTLVLLLLPSHRLAHRVYLATHCSDVFPVSLYFLLFTNNGCCSMYNLIYISKILSVLYTQFVATFRHCTGIICLNEGVCKYRVDVCAAGALCSVADGN